MGNDPTEKLQPPKLRLRRSSKPTKQAAVEQRSSMLTDAPEPVAHERPARTPRRPLLTGHAAAAVTGLLVGLWLVLAVWACERISESVRNTSSLGKAGFPLLLGIFILGVVGGAFLLRLFRVPSPGSVSFLGTGLVSVLTILFLTDHVDTLWGAAVVVVLALASFVLARWTAVRYLDAE